VQRIVKHYGPPGTGKTTELMRLVGEEVRVAGVPLREIAYLSFTRSAAEVIVSRMGATKDDVRWFRTLHGAACKQLDLSGSIIDWKDYAEFSKLSGMKVTPDNGEDTFDTSKSFDFNPALRAYNMSLTTLRPLKDVIREMPDHANLAAGRVNAFIEAWVKFKHDRRKFDFIDMLTEYDRIGVPLPCKTGFLDETQDLSDLQWRVAHKMLAACTNVHMAGDDDQSIYGFIGASEYGFLDHPCDEERVLAKSYRVPKAIGAAADKVIGHVPHRKEKHVEWKDEPGTIARLNLEAISMPWKKWLTQYEDVMVLTRHRKGAQRFSDDLKLAGVPHSLNGETMNTWDEAKILHSLYALRDGKSITPLAARKLAEAFGKDTRRYREMGPRDRVSEIPGVDLKTVDWLTQLSTTRRTRERYKALLTLIKKEGYEKLAEAPRIVVSTQHASKGKEADLIVIVPDCTNIVKRNISSATEIRLAYVAMTRAKKDVRVLMPRTDTYVHHFFGG
jgi:DNA helicase-2/ATP-dependent DNA helicase PcrA